MKLLHEYTRQIIRTIGLIIISLWKGRRAPVHAILNLCYSLEWGLGCGCSCDGMTVSKCRWDRRVPRLILETFPEMVLLVEKIYVHCGINCWHHHCRLNPLTKISSTRTIPFVINLFFVPYLS